IHGYDLLLMSDLPKSGPEIGKIYLKKNKEGKLSYTVMDLEGNKVKGFLDIEVKELNPQALREKQDKILEEISKKGHIKEDLKILGIDTNRRNAYKEHLQEKNFISGVIHIVTEYFRGSIDREAKYKDEERKA